MAATGEHDEDGVREVESAKLAKQIVGQRIAGIRVLDGNPNGMGFMEAVLELENGTELVISVSGDDLIGVTLNVTADEDEETQVDVRG
jgi:hypothetical protein